LLINIIYVIIYVFHSLWSLDKFILIIFKAHKVLQLDILYICISAYMHEYLHFIKKFIYFYNFIFFIYIFIYYLYIIIYIFIYLYFL